MNISIPLALLIWDLVTEHCAAIFRTSFKKLSLRFRECQICSTFSEMVISLISIPSNKRVSKVGRGVVI